jgi:hypothetical protein
MCLVFVIDVLNKNNHVVMVFAMTYAIIIQSVVLGCSMSDNVNANHLPYFMSSFIEFSTQLIDSS